MEQFEKVCKGLECCVESNSGACPTECPYMARCFDGRGLLDVYVHLLEDALALIRQQQEKIAELEAERTARVMTLEEVSVSEDPVYFEANALHEWAIRCCISGDVMFLTWRNGSCDCCRIDKYNKGWRCWTARPTDKQREAAKWDEPPKEET